MYVYSSEMPFSKKILYYREFNTKEQLILSKTNIIFPSENEENHVEFYRILKKILENCTENKEDLKDINLIEFFLYAIKIRNISIGDELKLILNENNKNITITLNLNNLMISIYQHFNSIFKEKISYKNIECKLDIPNFKSDGLYFNTDKKLYDYPFYEFISKLYVENSLIEFSQLNSNQKNDLYEKFPVTLKSKIEASIYDMLKSTSDINFFKISRLDSLKLNFFNSSIPYFLRLLFSFGDLRNIYQEYYMLASKNINPQYVDNLSISDRRVFFSFIEEEMEYRNQNAQESNSQSTNLQDLMLEYNG